MPPLEIERKFLVHELPDNYEEFPHEEIRQGYLEDGLRFRQWGDRYYCTRKFGFGLVVEEHESEISREEFLAAWPGTEGRRIEKTRTVVPLGDGLSAEVDIFLGELAGLQYVEVEFDDEQTGRSFVPPSWFGREVTDDPRYKNSSLARYGLPEGWEE